jgi:hypothetical protein
MIIIDKGEDKEINKRFQWRCTTYWCYSKRSIFKNSPLEMIKISVRTFYLLIHFFARGTDVTTTKWVLNDLTEKVSEWTIRRYFGYLRKAVGMYLSAYLPIIQLPGPVEIDETFIGARRRGDHGRIPGKHLTVFGN